MGKNGFIKVLKWENEQLEELIEMENLKENPNKKKLSDAADRLERNNEVIRSVAELTETASYLETINGEKTMKNNKRVERILLEKIIEELKTATKTAQGDEYSKLQKRLDLFKSRLADVECYEYEIAILEQKLEKVEDVTEKMRIQTRIKTYEQAIENKI